MDQPDLFGKEARTKNTSQKPAKKKGEYPKNHLPTDDNNSVRKPLGKLMLQIVLLGGVATGLWLVGEHFKECGYKWLGIILKIVGAFLFFATLPVAIMEIWPRWCKRAWALYCVLFAILAFLMIRSSIENIPSTPHFKLGVTVADRRGWPTQLTNDFLKTAFKLGDVEAFFPDDLFGFVVVPVGKGESNVALEFDLQNASFTSDVENVFVEVSTERQTRCTFSPLWQEDTRMDDTREYVFWNVDKLNAGSMQSLPLISFSVPPAPFRNETITNNTLNSSPFNFIKTPYPGLTLTISAICKQAPSVRWQFHLQIMEFEEQPLPRPLSLKMESQIGYLQAPVFQIRELPGACCHRHRCRSSLLWLIAIEIEARQ